MTQQVYDQRGAGHLWRAWATRRESPCSRGRDTRWPWRPAPVRHCPVPAGIRLLNFDWPGYPARPGPWDATSASAAETSRQSPTTSTSIALAWSADLAGARSARLRRAAAGSAHQRGCPRLAGRPSRRRASSSEASVRRRVDLHSKRPSAQGGGHVRMLGPDQRAKCGEDLLALSGRARHSELLLGQQQVGATAQGIRMIFPEHPFPRADDLFLQVPGLGRWSWRASTVASTICAASV